MKKLLPALVALSLLVGCGPPTEYHPNGKKSGEGSYNDGKKEGRWTEWPATNFKLVQLKHNKPSSFLTYTVQAEGEYKDGKKEGTWTFWEGPISKGISFEESRRKREEGEYKNGKREGLWTEWPGGLHPQEIKLPGEIQRTKNREHSQSYGGVFLTPDQSWARILDEKAGLSATSGDYRRDGRMNYWHGRTWLTQRGEAMSGEYRNGKKVGIWTQKGVHEKSMEKEYKDGRCVRWTVYVAYSHVIDKHYDTLTGVLLSEFDPTGLKLVEATLTGVTSWDRNGYKWSEGAMSEGELSGGGLSDGDYKIRKREGLWTFWRGNTFNGRETKSAEGEYKDGQREGRWTYWEGPISKSFAFELSGIYKAGKKVAELPNRETERSSLSKKEFRYLENFRAAVQNGRKLKAKLYMGRLKDVLSTEQFAPIYKAYVEAFGGS